MAYKFITVSGSLEGQILILRDKFTIFMKIFSVYVWKHPILRVWANLLLLSRQIFYYGIKYSKFDEIL